MASRQPSIDTTIEEFISQRPHLLGIVAAQIPRLIEEVGSEMNRFDQAIAAARAAQIAAE